MQLLLLLCCHIPLDIGNWFSGSLRREWEESFVDCPEMEKYAVRKCHNGPGACRLAPTVTEQAAMCKEYNAADGRCRSHEIVKDWMGPTCTGNSYIHLVL